MVSLAVTLGAMVLAPASAHGQDAQGRREAGPGGNESDEEDVGAESEVVEEKGGKRVTVIRFSGLDISGKLKSPQLLYFLNRLRAEFDRPRLPHRSFVPELVRSSRDDSL
jgi:hypothetical protein